MAIPELFNSNKEYQSMCLKAFDIEQQITKLQKEHTDLIHEITDIEFNFYNNGKEIQMQG